VSTAKSARLAIAEAWFVGCTSLAPLGQSTSIDGNLVQHKIFTIQSKGSCWINATSPLDFERRENLEAKLCEYQEYRVTMCTIDGINRRMHPVVYDTKLPNLGVTTEDLESQLDSVDQEIGNFIIFTKFFNRYSPGRRRSILIIGHD
jgi:hypothetical protein